MHNAPLHRAKHLPLHRAKHTGSLPANSSWLTFFKTNFFGKNYCNIKGRASRKEYWASTILWSIFAGLLKILLVITMPTEDSTPHFILINFIDLYGTIPLWALSFRRFHDFDMSAWWTLAIIPNSFLPFFKGDKHDNRFGKNIYEEVE